MARPEPEAALPWKLQRSLRRRLDLGSPRRGDGHPQSPLQRQTGWRANAVTTLRLTVLVDVSISYTKLANWAEY